MVMVDVVRWWARFVESMDDGGSTLPVGDCHELELELEEDVPNTVGAPSHDPDHRHEPDTDLEALFPEEMRTEGEVKDTRRRKSK